MVALVDAWDATGELCGGWVGFCGSRALECVLLCGFKDMSGSGFTCMSCDAVGVE